MFRQNWYHRNQLAFVSIQTVRPILPKVDIEGAQEVRWTKLFLLVLSGRLPMYRDSFTGQFISVATFDSEEVALFNLPLLRCCIFLRWSFSMWLLIRVCWTWFRWIMNAMHVHVAICAEWVRLDIVLTEIGHFFTIYIDGTKGVELYNLKLNSWNLIASRVIWLQVNNALGRAVPLGSVKEHTISIECLARLNNGLHGHFFDIFHYAVLNMQSFKWYFWVSRHNSPQSGQEILLAEETRHPETSHYCTLAQLVSKSVYQLLDVVDSYLEIFDKWYHIVMARVCILDPLTRSFLSLKALEHIFCRLVMLSMPLNCCHSLSNVVLYAL